MMDDNVSTLQDSGCKKIGNDNSTTSVTIAITAIGDASKEVSTVTKMKLNMGATIIMEVEEIMGKIHIPTNDSTGDCSRQRLLLWGIYAKMTSNIQEIIIISPGGNIQDEFTMLGGT
mmetsp:Transcript_18656/g.38317  ORF Transcript_18656/g.38317 Transcript_18656/m.38317 type:complete len:117 (+) Transcript_18656:998-1348(+)